MNTNKILLWEDRTKLWIETHRVLWVFIVFLLGIMVGMGGNYSLGGNIQQGAVMSLIYGSGLVVCELTMGGKGTN